MSSRIVPAAAALRRQSRCCPGSSLLALLLLLLPVGVAADCPLLVLLLPVLPDGTYLFDSYWLVGVGMWAGRDR